MPYTVPNLSIQYMTISAVAGVLIPLVLLLYLRRRDGTRPMVFLVGAAIFSIFAVFLEDLFHTLVFATPIGSTVQGHILLYALYGGLAAALLRRPAALSRSASFCGTNWTMTIIPSCTGQNTAVQRRSTC